MIFLKNASALNEGHQEGRNVDSSQLSLRQWEFHDLLFHAQTRFRRNDARSGGSYRFMGVIKPQKALYYPQSTDKVKLFKPDLINLYANDVSFTKVLESRKSVRPNKCDIPISIDQLGEFLYRSSRIREVWKLDHESLSSEELLSKPYPSGGSIYELEVYLIANNCNGLDPALYRYVADEHLLYKISERNNLTNSIVNAAMSASKSETEPQLLFIITARFGRLNWKYENIAYSLILKHVGVLYQTMYLVATAMGLAPCAIGGGNSELFSKVAKLECYDESSVGEFMLGTM